MPPDSLRAYAENLLEKLCAAFPLGYSPTLDWRRLRVTAGVAYYKEGRIALSEILLDGEERLRVTLIHEYAHLLAFKRHGRRGVGHGEGWQRAMKDLGMEARVRHTYEVSRNKPRQQVVYRCSKCGQSFTRARRLPKRRKYVHANCGGPLTLQTVQKVTTAVSLA
jgi:SprT protein